MGQKPLHTEFTGTLLHRESTGRLYHGTQPKLLGLGLVAAPLAADLLAEDYSEEGDDMVLESGVRIRTLRDGDDAES